jgi:DNA-binding transcriptional MerR regulator
MPTSTATLSPTQAAQSTGFLLEQYPYSQAYLCEQFQLQEATLKNLAQLLKLSPQVEPNSGQPHYAQRDLDLLRRAVELFAQGQSITQIVQTLTDFNAPSTLAPATAPAATQSLAPYVPAPRSNAAPSPHNTSTPEALASVIEAISSSKSLILDEMSRLLDDRLAGLDEVVVELIRTKSDNDLLRQKVASLTKEKEALKEELACFKPAQFGFYKKVTRG